MTTTSAPQQVFGHASGGNPAENYERYFVPAIAAPLATALVATANLRSGERVLDVACGTGIAARLSADQVAPDASAEQTSTPACWRLRARPLRPLRHRSNGMRQGRRQCHCPTRRSMWCSAKLGYSSSRTNTPRSQRCGASW
jgi:hypothetical protein